MVLTDDIRCNHDVEQHTWLFPAQTVDSINDLRLFQAQRCESNEEVHLSLGTDAVVDTAQDFVEGE